MESVWDYPRPPVVEESRRRARVVHGGVTVADSSRALRVLETSQPPGIYIPLDDTRRELLRDNARRTLCEWKGQAAYLDLDVDGHVAESVAWYYPSPVARYAVLADHAAFYPQAVDECWLDDERVEPNPGGFYGGWITSDIRGPFKGGPGTMGW